METRIIKRIYSDKQIEFVPQYKKFFAWKSFEVGCMFEIIEATFDTVQSAKNFLERIEKHVCSEEVVS